MVDRQDIDALLISALYGELTPADEARLSAHLVSHPADRSALDSLTEIRATLRTSGFSTVHVDPPQAISAMLLQEAARRAPKMVLAKDDREVGWFIRFLRTFAAHPAMAAAAMLVVVAGVGGLLYLKQGSSQFAESTVDEAPIASAMGSGSAMATAPGAQAPTLPPSVPADKDNFRVDLADSVKAEQPEQGKQKAKLDETVTRTAQLDGKASDATTPARKLTKDATAVFEGEKHQPDKKKSVDHGIIVNRDEPSPKELATVEKVSPKLTTKPMDQRAAEPAAGPGGATTSPTTGYANGVSGGAGSGAPPPPPPQVAKAPTKTPPTNAPAKADEAKPQTPVAQQQNTTLFAWAKDQHARVATLVRDGNCRDAAQIAAQIASRANDYYNQHVANDRALKACTAYFNDAREKDAERTNKARAQKRVDANEVSSPSPTSR